MFEENSLAGSGSNQLASAGTVGRMSGSTQPTISQTHIQMNRLNDNIARLNVVLGILHDRLNPILRPRGELAKNPEEVNKKEELVGMASAIRMQANSVGDLADEVNLIINRIEI